jgi:sulfoxide reductase catalytic subunit YedY
MEDAMAFRWKNDLTEKDVTPEDAWASRRQVLAGAAALGLAGIAGQGRAAPGGLEPNSWEEITTYNNYYEFGTDKTDPAKYADALTIAPWSVRIDGLVDRPADYAFEDIVARM